MGIISNSFTSGMVGKWSDSKRRSFFADLVIGMSTADIADKYEVKRTFVRMWRDKIERVYELYDEWSEDFGIRKGNIPMATVKSELEYLFGTMREAMDMAKEAKTPLVMAKVADSYIKGVELLGRSTGELGETTSNHKSTVTHVIQLPHVGPMKELSADEVIEVKDEMAELPVREDA